MNQALARDRCAGRWTARIERTHDLVDRYPAASAQLQFYRQILTFQQDLSCADSSRAKPDVPLRDQMDLSLALKSLPDLLNLIVECAPDLLAGKATTFQHDHDDEWLDLLRATVSSRVPEVDSGTLFFARTCLQPLAENLQLQLIGQDDFAKSTCPLCDGYPQLAVLRPEGDGGRRSLLCSFCLREWVYRRAICPYCGEEDKEKLPRFSPQESKNVQVFACDSCKHYLKAIDMTIDGQAVPLIDEVAAAVLDVWAVQNGYRKIVANLTGF